MNMTELYEQASTIPMQDVVFMKIWNLKDVEERLEKETKYMPHKLVNMNHLNLISPVRL